MAADDFRDVLRRMFFVAVGAAADASGKIDDYIAELATLGELRAKNSEGFIREIVDRINTEREELDVIVVDVLQDVFDTLGLATRRDVQAMEERLRYVNRKARRERGTKK